MKGYFLTKKMVKNGDYIFYCELNDLIKRLKSIKIT